MDKHQITNWKANEVFTALEYWVRATRFQPSDSEQEVLAHCAQRATANGVLGTVVGGVALGSVASVLYGVDLGHCDTAHGIEQRDAPLRFKHLRVKIEHTLTTPVDHTDARTSCISSFKVSFVHHAFPKRLLSEIYLRRELERSHEDYRKRALFSVGQGVPEAETVTDGGSRRGGWARGRLVRRIAGQQAVPVRAACAGGATGVTLGRASQARLSLPRLHCRSFTLPFCRSRSRSLCSAARALDALAMAIPLLQVGPAGFVRAANARSERRRAAMGDAADAGGDDADEQDTDADAFGVGGASGGGSGGHGAMGGLPRSSYSATLRNGESVGGLSSSGLASGLEKP
eukprot:6200075-Pleurochrysis_carterae.AAC.1